MSNISQTAINLKTNGRLFPLWIMTNFKKYILPNIIREEGEDPCNEKRIHGLTLYQEFIGEYLNYQSFFKDILLYHGVGSGKTYTAINIYNVLYNYTPKWNIFLLIPASLHDEPWLKDIKKYMSKNDFNNQFNNIKFIHYDSPFADAEFLKEVRNADSSRKSIFIIDEVHRFITNVYNNIYGKKGKRAQVIYDYIQQEKRENSDTRIILLSATPVVNVPFEFILIFNLLRPDIFPTSEALFEQIFITSGTMISLNINTKNMFQRRIIGLVSYYIGATPDKYAQKIVKYVSIQMEEFQEEIYNYLEEIEKKKEKALMKYSYGKVGDTMSTYLSYTRQACNFVFPIEGDKRPRPANFKINDIDAGILIEGKKKIDQKQEINEYNKAIQKYINNFDEYINTLIKQDKENNHTLLDDINKCNLEFKNIITAYMKSNNKKSLLLLNLYKLSPKFIRIIFNIKKTKGIVLVYSNYVVMEGLQMLKKYLYLFNYISIDDDKDYNKNIYHEDNLHYDENRYCEFHGSIDRDLRKINKEIFNNVNNKYGKYCKIIMISPAGAEGINLFNVRQVHIMEPYWNEIRIEQVIGRAIRICHHKDLPMNERVVEVFRYKMIRKNNKITSDEKLEEMARKKNNILLSFINAVKEVAIDCELFKAHNMMGTKYRCFNFSQESLLTDNIGPAYKSNIEYDIKNNNGLNSNNSKIVKIRVRKIRAVLKNSENTYSNELFYWYHDNTNIVYDLELNFPIGKLLKDENNNLVLLDNDIYIIHNIILIPKINL